MNPELEPAAIGATAAFPPATGVDPAGLAGFIASLAHDLRSPLGIVTQAMEELRTDLGESMTDDHRLLVSLADRGLRRLGRISETLSLVAALDSGHFELAIQSVDLVALVRAAIATAVSLEPRREVELVSVLPEPPLRILADEPRLAHAISEIVINAIRHARGHVRVHLEVTDGRPRLVIEDDGQGVPELGRLNLFRRFVGLGSRSGLGVGLSIAHDVIVGHSGTVALEASTLPPGRPDTVGARFVVSLRADEPAISLRA